MPILKELLYPEIRNDKVYLTNQPFSYERTAREITNRTKGTKELIDLIAKASV